MSNKYSEQILELLQKIDEGYKPTWRERYKLAKVRILDLYDTKISELPESIGKLTALRWLGLGDTQISKLPESIGNLTAMQLLNLNGTQISELPESIGNLTAMQVLNLNGTQISELPESIGNLTKLQELDLSDTQIRKLPESIGKLIALQELTLNDTQINELPNSLGSLTALQRLNLSRTQISELPENISRLTALEELELSETKINTLPNSIGELPKLEKIDLSFLTLDRIPESLANKGIPFGETILGYRTGINLLRTTLTEQNVSIFLNTPELIPSLYEHQVTIRESKVIFLGDGAAGKSYTIKRFINGGKKETEDNPYTTSETPGVEIVDCDVDRGEDSFTIHFWDFGGQQILHSMHRCFLTDKTCYVVVVKSRDTEANRLAGRWLENVKAFAPNSPVLLLVNCWENDDGRRSIDETNLRKDFPNIVDVVYCSAKQAEDGIFCEFMDKLIDMAAASGGCNKTVNSRWAQARKTIKDENKNYLTKARYYKICENCGIGDADAAPLLTFFNNLGVCFSYHRDKNKKELAEYKLLNPVWLTNAIYAVIEEGMVYAENGRIKASAVRQMLGNSAPTIVREKEYRRTMPDIIYKDFECEYVTDVAAAYNLCYRVNRDTLFFPALCTNNTPVTELDAPEGFTNHMEYNLVYEYLPDSVVHQLMIRCLKKELVINNCWLRGMVLGGMDNYKAVIRMGSDYKTLKIDIYSRPDFPIYDLFTVLKGEIDNVNRDLNLKAEEFIAKGEDSFPLMVLLNLKDMGQDLVLGNKTYKKYSVSELLGEVYDDWALTSISVENGMIIIPKVEIKLHEMSKNNERLRNALWKVYRTICQYCNNPITSFREMHVDHVFPENYKETDLPQIKPFVDYLKGQGFNINKPNYVENYLPSCPVCNLNKSNHLSPFPLVWYIARSMRNAPKVLKEMEKQEKI